MSRQNFSSSDRLNGLAQTHLIADQHPANPRRKQGTFGLIRIKGRLEQFLKTNIGGATRKQTVEREGPPLGIAQPGDKVLGIVVEPKLVASLGNSGEQAIKPAKLLHAQSPPAGGIENPAGSLHRCCRAIRTRPKI